MKKTIALFASLGAILANSMHAAVLAGWNFEINTPSGVAGSAGPVVNADIGSGILHGYHASSGSVWETAVGNGSRYALGADLWSTGDYYEFSTSTIGYKDISVTFDQIGYERSPRDWQFSFSIDGTEFFDFGPVYSIQRHAPGNLWNVTTPLPSGVSRDLTSISALENATTVYFRLTQIGTASVSPGMEVAGGFDRIDNVAINGTPIPEASAALLGAVAVVCQLRRCREQP